jgi:hypothetical protein
MNENQITVDEIILPEVTFYGCNHCNSYFKSKPSRSRHVKIFHPDKLKVHKKRTNHPCSYNGCDHVAKSRSSRRSHEIKVHEKTYGCDICSTYFCSERGMKRHCKRYHMDSSCTICDIPLFNEKAFDQHMYKCHQS